MIERGKYCGCHPATKREKDVIVSKPGEPIMTLGEGMTISGIECEFRRYTKSLGWQSYCRSPDRIAKGCERAYLEDA